MEKYYVFDRDCVGRWIKSRTGTNTPKIKWFDWRRGHVLPDPSVIPDPLTFDLKPMSPHSADHSPYMPSFLRAAAPIFRDDLIDALFASGVDNMECYNAAIHDPTTGKIYTNYKVVNVVGLVAAVDMDNSNATINPNGPPVVDVDLDGFTIDARVGGIKFFRLAESTNALIIHESVKNNLEKAGFTDLAFYEPEKTAL